MGQRIHASSILGADTASQLVLHDEHLRHGTVNESNLRALAEYRGVPRFRGAFFLLRPRTLLLIQREPVEDTGHTPGQSSMVIRGL